MKKHFVSINWKIWMAIVGTMLIMLICGFFAHSTIFKETKNELIIGQLQKLSQTKIEEESLLPTKYEIEKEGRKFDIRIDLTINSNYTDEKEYTQVIDEIIGTIEAEAFFKEEGRVRSSDLDYYYYVDWNMEKDNAVIFLTSTRRSTNIQTKTISYILGVLIIGLFSSKLVTIRIARPIQELKKFAEEISKHNWKVSAPATNNDEIGQLAESLEKMKNSLQKIEERERLFLQSISHDLKTPVMIIQGYAQAILDGVNLNKEVSMAEVIKAESDRLERKIHQLLTLNVLRYSQDYYEIEEFVRVDKVIKNLVKKFSLIQPDISWELNIEEIEVKGNPEALLIAFENIIENQIRYANRSIRILMNTNDQLEIKISNDGPRFETSNPMELFDVYTRDRNGKFGLGLAIASKIIKNHKGEIEAYNTENGVEFKIKFN
ncbi:sensor histidine kinase [Alkaliphilus oremlandii]|uniref:histidine kinase n=1 Tax=Alkaliphilus oremlandii (strain OhILAs) TaxID=350688 RepID=A8MM61_ALKOO|nr:HAMP domain-containing sensor histidine kinase [Alkaliphilus oremlandii]ABW18228.1 integral membrane sensor signal transduction histidine kinase [Alkaliphilus oremlandii OhILAs]